MTDVVDLREQAVLPNGIQEGQGYHVPIILRRQPVTETGFTARAVDAEFARIEDVLQRPVPPNLLTIAKWFGAAYFVGRVSATEDTIFQHTLGRIPVLIVMSININGQQGQVVGRPEAGGPNNQRWTATSIFVRSTATDRYAFLVI